MIIRDIIKGEFLQPIELNLPRQLIFGDRCFSTFINNFRNYDYKRVFVVADNNISDTIQMLRTEFSKAGISVIFDTTVDREPTVDKFKSMLKHVELHDVDAIIGIGGGSVLDVAKLLAVFYRTGYNIEEYWGIEKIVSRKLYLVCLPTTAGTGSEVSPNAILLDEQSGIKIGFISHYLVPDAAYIDPELTYSVPPSVTASTGLDALTHCIEAYANKFANPMSDMFSANGIKHIASSLLTAYKEPYNREARRNVAYGSLMGGICLGLVNTAAVHALAYPLGSRYNIPHGIANAILLAPVIETNLSSAPHRYAEIAVLMGIEPKASTHETAKNCIEYLKQLCSDLCIPNSISVFGIGRNDIEELTKSALLVQRLLKNNVKELNETDIKQIYSALII